MKRNKKIYILLGILAVFIIATLSVSKIEQHREAIRNSNAIIMDVDAKEVTKLSWKYYGNTYSFHYENGRWIYDDDASFPVSEDKIRSLLSQFNKLGAAFVIDDVQDYDQYGLKSPLCIVTITANNDVFEIKLGSYSKMDEQRYASIGDGKVYLLKTDPMDDFDVSIRDLIQNDNIPVFNTVNSIRFQGQESYQITYEKDSKYAYTNNDVYFTKVSGTTIPLDTKRISSYLRSISNLSLGNYMTYQAASEDLEKYGLDHPDLKIIIEYEDEGTQTFVLQISRDPNEKESASDPKDDKEGEEEVTAYARINDSSIIYKIPSSSYQNLMKASSGDFRHLEVLSMAFSDISQADIRLEGNSYLITAKGSGKDRTYYYGDEKISIDGFKKALESMTADRFVTETAKGKEELSLKLMLDNHNYPEIGFTFYRYDGTYCLAYRDGKPYALIKRSSVVSLIEAIHAIVLN